MQPDDDDDVSCPLLVKRAADRQEVFEEEEATRPAPGDGALQPGQDLGARRGTVSTASASPRRRGGTFRGSQSDSAFFCAVSARALPSAAFSGAFIGVTSTVTFAILPVNLYGAGIP